MGHINATLTQAGEKAFSSEGGTALQWVLIDYSDLIVHIFKEEVRVFYGLEHLWGDAPQVELSDLAQECKDSESTKALGEAADLGV